MKKTIITIERQYGSGGSIIGKLAAESGDTAGIPGRQRRRGAGRNLAAVPRESEDGIPEDNHQGSRGEVPGERHFQLKVQNLLTLSEPSVILESVRAI